MSDIVERLMIECGSRWGDEDAHRLERQAAEAIDRLRAINAEQAHTLNLAKEELTRARADLREVRAINAELLASLEWATKQIGILSQYIEMPQALACFNDCLAAIAKAKS